MADNLTYYNYARQVPKEAQKTFNNGRFSGTDINPMWRIKMLTEMFGPCGVGWYTEITRQEQVELVDDEVICFMDINLYVKIDGEWSKPIFGTGGNKLKTKTSKGYIQTSDEGWKMTYTDALGAACKNLGIGADVYWQNDKTKYTSNDNDAPSTPFAKPTTTTKAPDPVPEITDFPDEPKEVPQELLTALAKKIRAPHKGDNTWLMETFSPIVKKYNGGKNNYASIADAEVRLALYNALKKEFTEELKND